MAEKFVRSYSTEGFRIEAIHDAGTRTTRIDIYDNPQAGPMVQLCSFTLPDDEVKDFALKLIGMAF